MALTTSQGVAVVGAAGDPLTEGAAYVYLNDHATWRLAATLTPADGSGSGFFGASIAMSGDEIAVGAWGVDAVELFGRVSDGWERKTTLSLPETSGAHFGSALAFDGDLLVISAEHGGSEPDRPGAVYLFARRPGGWAVRERLAPDRLTSGALFGASLAMADGILAVGAMHDSPTANGSGAVYLYEVSEGASRLLQRIEPPADANAHYFGSTLALRGDLLAIGAPGGDYGDYRSGAVFLYRPSANGWQLMGRLLPTDSGWERFGLSLAVMEAGLAVGVATDNEIGTGRVSVLFYPLAGSGSVVAPTVLFDGEAQRVRYVSLAPEEDGLLVGVATGESGRGVVYDVAIRGEGR